MIRLMSLACDPDPRGGW